MPRWKVVAIAGHSSHNHRSTRLGDGRDGRQTRRRRLRKLLRHGNLPCDSQLLPAAVKGEGLEEFEPPACSEAIDFDVLVGADGGKSSVRSDLGVAVETHDTYSWRVQEEEEERYGRQPSEQQLNVRVATISRGGVRQVSILLNFKAMDEELTDTSSGGNDINPQCPRLKLGSDGEPLDPWAIGFHPIAGTGPGSTMKTDGVYAVFKRFYYGTCQLQVLFLHEQVRHASQSFRGSSQLFVLFAASQAHCACSAFWAMAG